MSLDGVDVNDHVGDVGEEVCEVVLEAAHLLRVAPQDHPHPLTTTQQVHLGGIHGQLRVIL